MAFHIALNMAGAVSAGAYTAGVLDFLVEALDEWYAAKAQHLPNVPMHDVVLDVISGASAGGMCSAISSVALQEKFDHITAPNPAAGVPRNRLYQSWVDTIDIIPLLGVDDLPGGQGPVKSLLDSKPIEAIARTALTINPANAITRAWVAPKLSVILTLSNLRGVPYSVDESNEGSFEEKMGYHADRIVFTVAANGAVETDNAYALNYSDAANPNWQTLATAAMATGAFPIMLAARVIDRKRADYETRKWNINNEIPNAQGMCQEQDLVQPSWDDKVVPATFENAYVDGGMTNNNPFECARQFLVNAAGNDGHNPRAAELANAAVISVAPFPGDDSFDPSLKAEDLTPIDKVLGGLLGVLVNQSRFQGEELILTKDPDVYSRFAISPSDDSAGTKPALLCAALDAFGGFVDRKFRDHDYQLGRRNCQKFLTDHFILPEDNPIIQAGITPQRAFGVLQDGKYWYPIIPLMPGVAKEVPTPNRPDFYTTEARLEQVAHAAESRVRALAQAIVNSPNSHHPFLGFIVKIILEFEGGKIYGAALSGLKTALADQTAGV